MTHPWTRACTRLLLAGIALMLSACASVLRVPCETPRISNRWAPSAYLVKLPLAATDPEQMVDGRHELDALLDASTIAMAFEVGDTHLTLLDERQGQECDISDVYDTVTTNSRGLFWRRLFHSAVFVWGDVYGSGDELFIKLSMRVYWNGPEGTARVVYNPPAIGRPLVFTGRFPRSTIAFPRRKLDADTVRRLKDGLRHLEARARPSLDAPMVKLTENFAVSSSNNGWLKLRSMRGTEAWVSQANVAPLAAQLLPELAFVQAVVAYLNFKALDDPGSARRSLASLQAFREGLPAGTTPSRQLHLPLAIADVITASLGQARANEKKGPDTLQTMQSGFLQLETHTSLSEELKDVTAPAFTSPEVGYEQAQAQMPADADILTLSALGLIAGCCHGGDARDRMARITQALEAAREIDSADPVAVENLLNWYRLLRTLDPADLPRTRDEIERRAASLQRIVESL